MLKYAGLFCAFVLMLCSFKAWPQSVTHNDGVIEYTYKSGAIRCTSQKSFPGEIVVLLESLRPNTTVKFEELFRVGDAYVLSAWMSMKEPASKFAGEWNVQPVMIELEYKLVPRITLTGEKVYQSGNVTVLVPAADLAALDDFTALLGSPSVQAVASTEASESKTPLFPWPLREETVCSKGEVRCFRGPGELLCQSQVTPDGQITALIQGTTPGTTVILGPVQRRNEAFVLKVLMMTDMKTDLPYPAMDIDEIEIVLDPIATQAITLAGEVVYQSDGLRILMPAKEELVLAEATLSECVEYMPTMEAVGQGVKG
jgi:hypothetical protein